MGNENNSLNVTIKDCDSHIHNITPTLPPYNFGIRINAVQDGKINPEHIDCIKNYFEKHFSNIRIPCPKCSTTGGVLNECWHDITLILSE